MAAAGWESVARFRAITRVAAHGHGRRSSASRRPAANASNARLDPRRAAFGCSVSSRVPISTNALLNLLNEPFCENEEGDYCSCFTPRGTSTLVSAAARDEAYAPAEGPSEWGSWQALRSSVTLRLE